MNRPKKRTILILSFAAGVLAIAVLLAVVLPSVIKTEDRRKSGMEESAGSPDMIVDLMDETGEDGNAETHDKMRRMEQELKELREELQNARMKAAASSGDQEKNDTLPDDDPDLEYFIEIPVARAARFRLADDDLNENGIPDEWEKEFGISAEFTDPDSDEDSDGFTLLQEYQAKTNPLDPLSHPKYITQTFVSAISQQSIKGLELVSIDRTKADKKDWVATFNVLRNNRRRSEFVRINAGTFKNNDVDFCLVDIETDEMTQEPVAYIQRIGKQERIPCRVRQPVFDPMPRVRLVNANNERVLNLLSVGSDFKLGTEETWEELYHVVSIDPDAKKVVVESEATGESFVLLPKPPDPPKPSGPEDPTSDEDSDGFSLEQENDAGTDPADPLSHPKYINQILVSTVSRLRFPGLELVSVDRSRPDKKDWVATFNVVLNNRLRQAFVQIEKSSSTSLGPAFKNDNVAFNLVDIEMDETMREPIAYIQRVGREERIACRVRQPVYDPTPRVLLFNALNDRKIITTSVGSVFRLGTSKSGQEQYRVVSADPVTKDVVVESVGDSRETINIPLKPLNEDPASDEDSDGFTLSQENRAGTDPGEPLSHPKYISQIFVSDINRQTFPGLELISADMTNSNKKEWSAAFNVAGGNGSHQVSVQIYSSRASRSLFSNSSVDFRLIDIRIDERTQEPVAVIQRVGREENIPCRVRQPVYDPIARVSLFNAINGRIVTLSVGSSFKLGTDETGEEQYRVVSADPVAKKVVVESVGWMTGTFTLRPAPRSEGN